MDALVQTSKRLTINMGLAVPTHALPPSRWSFEPVNNDKKLASRTTPPQAKKITSWPTRISYHGRPVVMDAIHVHLGSFWSLLLAETSASGAGVVAETCQLIGPF
jgi:hypothetical protein